MFGKYPLPYKDFQLAVLLAAFRTSTNVWMNCRFQGQYINIRWLIRDQTCEAVRWTVVSQAQKRLDVTDFLTEQINTQSMCLLRN